ncbi:unnamed protein product [Adineta steineri]|uniref:Uncharacterized protein n=1 Tax=Adineta steineri TaxID=433720 RepID=A0A818R389_9BILA|nr:unnamed protein product [Adineta steineri]
MTGTNDSHIDQDEDSEATYASIWHRLYRTSTNSSYRRSSYYNIIDLPKNNLDFRLRTCYNHAKETFAS